MTTVLACRLCMEAGASVEAASPIERRPYNDDPDAGEFVCPAGHVVGCWADGGELDLGLVRE